MRSWRMWAWALYDFANTAFSALYVTVFFPFFVTQILGGTPLHVGLTFGLSMLVAGLIMPAIGALSDASRKKTPFIFTFTLVCVIFTGMTGYLPLWAAVIAGFVANAAYHTSLCIYNAFLPQIASSSNQGRVSGYGVGLGYIGTIASIVSVAFIAKPYGLETLDGVQVVFIITAVFFFVFSLPLFITFWYEKSKQIFVLNIRSTLREVWTTLQSLPKQSDIFYFLLGGFFYSNAITAAIVFLGLYARFSVRVSIDSFLFGIYPLLAIAAAIGAYLSGPLTDRCGAKKVLICSGGIWILALLGLIYTSESIVMFTLSSSLGGAAMGAVWTARRPLLVKLAPGRKIGEYFGFEQLSDKFSGVLGPILFGVLTKYDPSYVTSLWSMILFFGAGIITYAAMRQRLS
ncbi:MAG: MFS transporter [Nanoarchaeota archaeon]